MIPSKLVETIFQRLWVLVLSTLLVPILVVVFKPHTEVFRSSSVVWVTAPVADAQPALGNNNPWITPAQNQAQVINDLLSTQAFRAKVVTQAGLLGGSASPEATRRVAAEIKVFAAATGVNLLALTADADSAEHAQSIVAGVLDQYLVRATAEIQQKAEVANAYYQQQLPIANQALEARRADVAAYLRANPKAADPTNAASLDPNYRTLLSQVEAQSKVVDGIAAALQSVQLREASAPQSQQASFRVQDAPLKPNSPMPVSITSRFGVPAAGLMFGILIGCAYLYFAYRTDHTIRSSADLTTIGVPVLGYVPVLQSTPLWIRLTPARWWIAWRRRDFARSAATAIAGSKLVMSPILEEAS